MERHGSWEKFLDEKIVGISDIRAPSFEWNRIQDAVKDADGDITHGTQIYRHYVPYEEVLEALEQNLSKKKRGDGCEWLNKSINYLYKDCQTFPLTKLEPPNKGYQKTFEIEKTRKVASSWMTWALEAICLLIQEWRYTTLDGGPCIGVLNQM